MKNQQLVSTSQQCSSTPISFGQGFLSNKQCDNTGAVPIHSWPGTSWFVHVPSTEISTGGSVCLWC